MITDRKLVKKKKPIRMNDLVFHICNYTFLMLINIIMLYPMIYTVAVSFSETLPVSIGKVWLYPIGFETSAYEKIITDRLFLRSYLNTVIYSCSATVISVFMLCITSYPLSIPNLHGKGTITFFFAVTMFFGGGMIPSYLCIKNYGMLDTIWAVILPGALSTWYIVLCRTFFQGIPTSLRESAQLDGAGEIVILFKIIVPLSKALLAVMALYVLVGQWNSYFGPFLYLSTEKKFPLQVTLRRILDAGKVSRATEGMFDPEQVTNTVPETIRSAAIIVTILPVLCTYPFVQKYFVKGVMIGSIKG